MWTNESINIWTHLIGGLWFLLMIIYDNIYTIPGINGTIQDNLVVTTINICFAVSVLSQSGSYIGFMLKA